ncbi:winged helix-turn-helix domain-containing protein [Thalassotalea atypica]|uniref:winged helix-turn-helix domain-containing protein n=1 Tax=Thalassotalea atypica TaxID=2054316 RepID=UPI00257340A6|nr:winged helix-turn-helix domain-containing protein [Thalassotalea atypica]
MDVKFSDYRFSRDQLILYKQEQIIPLKHTQALLLDFFLAAPEQVHSKEAIMDVVWQDKVVSEQVVFQTISQLRAIFGSSSIKTFSKKGYQWQLALSVEPAPKSEVQNKELQKSDVPTAELSNVIAERPTLFNSTTFKVTIVIGVMLVMVFYLRQAFTAKDLVSIHLVQSAEALSSQHQAIANLAKQQVLEEKFSIEKITGENSSRQYFAAPLLAWQQSKIPDKNWLLWTDIFRPAEGAFLNYGISNGSIYWQGYVYAETEQQLTEKLSTRLIQLEQLGLFSPTSSTLDINTLNAMIKMAPDDADLLILLAKYYLDLKQYDVAITYAQKLANLSTSFEHSPYRAQAQWLMAEVYNKRHKYLMANNALKNMAVTLENTSLWSLHFEYIKASAWLAYRQHNIDTMFDVLNQGMEFGQNQADVLTQFELHILYSILAKKGGDDHQKYAHLNEAQALLLEHNLDQSNFAVVYYHFAIFNQDLSNAVPYFEKIVKLPRTINNGWIIDHATELLIDQYIARQDFELALSLLSEQIGSAKYMLSMARIYEAQQEPHRARAHFEKAFELARLQYEVHIGIDSALMLYQLSATQPEKQAEYLDYLKRNANETWLSEQMDKLALK